LPCGAAYKLAGITDAYAKYPKLKALAARTAAVPEIKEYLTTSKTIGQGGFGHVNDSQLAAKPKMIYFPISGI